MAGWWAITAAGFGLFGLSAVVFGQRQGAAGPIDESTPLSFGLVLTGGAVIATGVWKLRGFMEVQRSRTDALEHNQGLIQAEVAWLKDKSHHTEEQVARSEAKQEERFYEVKEGIADMMRYWKSKEAEDFRDPGDSPKSHGYHPEQ